MGEEKIKSCEACNLRQHHDGGLRSTSFGVYVEESVRVSINKSNYDGRAFITVWANGVSVNIPTAYCPVCGRKVGVDIG